jgi:hypothetical protein
MAGTAQHLQVVEVVVAAPHVVFAFAWHDVVDLDVLDKRATSLAFEERHPFLRGRTGLRPTVISGVCDRTLTGAPTGTTAVELGSTAVAVTFPRGEARVSHAALQCGRSQLAVCPWRTHCRGTCTVVRSHQHRLVRVSSLIMYGLWGSCGWYTVPPRCRGAWWGLRSIIGS